MSVRSFGLGAALALFTPVEIFQVPYPADDSGRITTAQGIDNFGRVTGQFQFEYAPGYPLVRGYVRHPGGAFEYPIKLPDDHGSTAPYAINTAGGIAGTYYPFPKIFRGFVRANGVFSTIAIGDVTGHH